MLIKLNNLDNFIINCDDFGMNNSINEACINLNKKNKLNSVSVIMNYQNEEQIKKYLKEFKGMVGLHLNFTESGPLNKDIAYKLLNIDCFKGYKKLVFSYLLGKLNYKLLFQEAENQLLRLKKINGKIDHIDSHQHIHMLPIIWKVTHDLAKKYDVKRIRNSVEPIFLTDHISIKIKKVIFIILNKFNTKKKDIRYLDFFGHSLQNEKNYKELLFAQLKKKNKNKKEIMVHLSLDENISDNEKIKFGRKREFKIISSIDFSLPQ